MAYFAVAGLQLELSGSDNLSVIATELESLAKRFPWVDMVVLGELAVFGASLERVDPLPGEVEQAFCEMAAAGGFWLLPGSLHEQGPDGLIYNTTPVIDPSGTVVARYRKMFPFLPYESGVTPGSEFVVFDVPEVGRFGVSICYDMWFPETTRTLAWMGAEVILHPTMTPTIDRDVELAIARTNAVVNQCYFVDVNSAGTYGNGRSVVVGPDGTVLHEAGAGREIIALELDLEHVRRSRERGALGLGQVLKSFRDSAVRFPPYLDESAKSETLQALGPLVVPRRAR